MIESPRPIRDDVAQEWVLRPDIAFVNHGSFGATPRRVLDRQRAWQLKIEAEPIEMVAMRSPGILQKARKAIGKLVGADAKNIGLVTNATEGINAVLRSLEFKPGDELLTTTHVYNAIRQAMKYVATRAGASYREVKIPLPISSPAQIVDAVVTGLSKNTRLLVLDHVTSATGLIFPVEPIVKACAKRCIDVMIDGAHSAGMLPIQIDAIGAAYYSGNLHKWVCAPKGCGFLYVRPDRRAGVHPTTISHFIGEGMKREFDWQGTRDFSSWFSIPEAIAFFDELGWGKVRRHNHALALWAHDMLTRKWGVTPISPADGSMLGSMATIKLPAKFDAMSKARWNKVTTNFYRNFGVVVPFFVFEGKRYLRVSAQIYNRPEDYQRLAAAIESVGK